MIDGDSGLGILESASKKLYLITSDSIMFDITTLKFTKIFYEYSHASLFVFNRKLMIANY